MTNGDRIEAGGASRAIFRLAIVAITSLAVGALCAFISHRIEPGALMSAVIGSGCTWILCTGTGCWLVWRIVRKPDSAFFAWLVVAISHFVIVGGGSLALILMAELHPTATLLSSCATCFVFVYGGAWMTSAIRTDASDDQTQRGAS